MTAFAGYDLPIQYGLGCSRSTFTPEEPRAYSTFRIWDESNFVPGPETS